MNDPERDRGRSPDTDLARIADGGPDWLLAGVEPEHDRYAFARVSRATYRDSAFLDHRIRPVPTEVCSLSGAKVDRLLTAHPPRPAGWIFHTAFCCSTLLAHCLDHPGRTLVLREPAVLSRLAARLRPDGPGAGPDVRRRTLALMERGYGEAPVVIKPSNYANALLPEVGAPGRPAAAARPIVLMSCGLKPLILSVMKKRVEAQRLLPSFTAALLQDSDYARRVRLPPLEDLDLARLAVAFWHAQRHQFQQWLAANGEAAVMLLSMERFLDEPETVLREIDAHFGLDLEGTVWRETVDRGAFRRHAKSGAVYGADTREAESREVEARHRSRIDAALDWAASLLAVLPVTPLDAAEATLAG